jgi:hypothetical protein
MCKTNRHSSACTMQTGTVHACATPVDAAMCVRQLVMFEAYAGWQQYCNIIETPRRQPCVGVTRHVSSLFNTVELLRLYLQPHQLRVSRTSPRVLMLQQVDLPWCCCFTVHTCRNCCNAPTTQKPAPAYVKTHTFSHLHSPMPACTVTPTTDKPQIPNKTYLCRQCSSWYRAGSVLVASHSRAAGWSPAHSCRSAPTHPKHKTTHPNAPSHPHNTTHDTYNHQSPDAEQNIPAQAVQLLVLGLGRPCCQPSTCFGAESLAQALGQDTRCCWRGLGTWTAAGGTSCADLCQLPCQPAGHRTLRKH